MSKIKWDQVGEKYYETGTKNGVIYQQASNGTYPKGVAWNGLTGVTESPSGAEASPIYADDDKYVELRSTEEFGATVTAYTYPPEVAECDGTRELIPGVHIGQQARKAFGLSYRTVIGNDTELDEHGYKLHLIYGATMSPSEKAYSTKNDSPEAIEFSWELSTVPVKVTGFKSTSILTIDSRDFNTEALKAKLDAIEAVLYGTDGVFAEATGLESFAAGTIYYEKVDGEYVVSEDDEVISNKVYYTATTAPTDARLPLPDEVASIMNAA